MTLLILAVPFLLIILIGDLKQTEKLSRQSLELINQTNSLQKLKPHTSFHDKNIL